MKAKDFYPGLFSRHAAAYARRHADIRAAGGDLARNRMLELVAAKPGERVLDVACGPGNLTALLVEAGAVAVGVDLAAGMLELARAGLPQAQFLRMDGERLAFAAGAFEAVVCGHGFQFMPDHRKAFAEARRVLCRAGRLGATLPRVTPRSDAVGEAADRWLAARPVAADLDPYRLLAAGAGELRSDLLQAGFASVELEEVSEPIVWPDAEHALRLATSMVDLASRLELSSREQVEAFHADAIERLRARHGGGPIQSLAVGLVIFARA